MGGERSTSPNSNNNDGAKRLADGGARMRLMATHLLPQLDCACGIGCLPDGTLVVANTGSHSLLMVHPDSGEVTGHYGKEQNAKFRGPRGIVCDQTAIYVADCYNCVVKKIHLTNGRVEIAGSYGGGDGQLRYPHGLALGPEQTLYVADASNGRVVAFDSQSLAYKFAFEMNHEPTTSSSFDLRLQALGKEAKWFGALAEKHVRPINLAILGDELFITDPYNRRLQVFTLSGQFKRFLQPTFAEGALRGQLLLTLAEGIAAANGRLYVSDKRGDAIHILRPSDGFALQYLPFLVSRPHALAGVASDGSRVFIVDEVRSEVQVLTNLGSDGPAPGGGNGGKKQGASPNKTPSSSSSSTKLSSATGGGGEWRGEAKKDPAASAPGMAPAAAAAAAAGPAATDGSGASAAASAPAAASAASPSSGSSSPGLFVRRGSAGGRAMMFSAAAGRKKLTVVGVEAQKKKLTPKFKLEVIV